MKCPLQRHAELVGRMLGALADLLPEPANFDDDDRIVDELGGEADEPYTTSAASRVAQEAGARLAEHAIQNDSDIAKQYTVVFGGYSLGSNPEDIWTPAATTAIIEMLIKHSIVSVDSAYIRCGCHQMFRKWADWHEHVAPLIARHLSATVIP